MARAHSTACGRVVDNRNCGKMRGPNPMGREKASQNAGTGRNQPLQMISTLARKQYLSLGQTFRCKSERPILP